MTPENWLPVAGYEGLYEISDLGRIRSLARTVHRKNGRPLTVRQRILKPRQTGSSLGHLQVALYKPGGRKDCTVDRLVKLTFGDALAPSGAPVRSQTGGTTSPKTEALEANCAQVARSQTTVPRWPGSALTRSRLEGIHSHDGKENGPPTRPADS
jgi:hypothetical protein